MTQTLIERLNDAIHSDDPGRAVRAIVMELAAEGWQKKQVYEALEGYLLALRASHDYLPAEEDAVLDVMDTLDGWCHPDARLMPESNQH